MSALGQPAGIKKASLVQRIITGFFFVVIMLLAIVAGNTFMLLPALMSIFAVLGTREFYRIVAPDMAAVPTLIGMLFAASMPLVIFASGLFYENLNPIISPETGLGGMGPLLALLYLVLVVFSAYLVWAALTTDARSRDAAVSFFGALYLGIPLSCLLLIREMNSGMMIAVAIVFSIWAADSFAYLGGSLFGRHKLAPKISPKKSWEGLAAGAVGAIVFWHLIPFFWAGQASWFAAIVLGIIVTASALIGDLFESRIKREAGVKDSGTLLPGHGGLLDRIDSLLLVAPLMFVVLSTIGVYLGVFAH